MPARGSTATVCSMVLSTGSIYAFLFLTFWTIDISRLCAWFIDCFSRGRTLYPKSTLEYFSRLNGGMNPNLLPEWIDLRLIADLTETVGKLIYFPFIILFLLLLARNSWWDRWSWSWGLLVFFSLNLALAVISVVVVQRAAHRAKRSRLATLEAQLNQLQVTSSGGEKEERAIALGKKLIKDVQQLKTGAFADFWENPIIGALLVPSGGTVIVESLLLIFGPLNLTAKRLRPRRVRIQSGRRVTSCNYPSGEKISNSQSERGSS